MESAEKEARRALSRLRRSMEKARRELDALAGSLRHAEGEDFPEAEYEALDRGLDGILRWIDEEGARLQAKILRAGGLEPGRIRRSSTRGPA